MAAGYLACSPALGQPETCVRKHVDKIDTELLKKSLALHEDWVRTRRDSAPKGQKLVLRYTDLNGVDLAARHLESVDLEGSKLEAAKLEGAQLVGANLACAQLASARLGNANFFEANLENADLSSVQAQKAMFVRARLFHANLAGANFSDADLRSASLQGARLVGTALAGADLTGAAVDAAIWRPSTVPAAGRVASLAGADSLIAYPAGDKQPLHNRDYSGLTMLAKALKDGGQADLERVVLGIREREKTRDEWQSDRPFDWVVAAGRTVLWGLLIDYGKSPEQALLVVAVAVFVFAALYFFFATPPPALAGLKTGNVLQVRRKGGPTPGRHRADWTTTEADIVEPVEPTGVWQAARWAFGLSLWGSVRIGVGALNLSEWIVRLQRRDREIVTEGWVRTLLGLQSLLSNVAIALFLVAFFGRPFD